MWPSWGPVYGPALQRVPHRAAQARLWTRPGGQAGRPPPFASRKPSPPRGAGLAALARFRSITLSPWSPLRQAQGRLFASPEAVEGRTVNTTNSAPSRAPRLYNGVGWAKVPCMSMHVSNGSLGPFAKLGTGGGRRRTCPTCILAHSAGARAREGGGMRKGGCLLEPRREAPEDPFDGAPSSCSGRRQGERLGGPLDEASRDRAFASSHSGPGGQGGSRSDATESHCNRSQSPAAKASFLALDHPWDAALHRQRFDSRRGILTVDEGQRSPGLGIAGDVASVVPRAIRRSMSSVCPV